MSSALANGIPPPPPGVRHQLDQLLELPIQALVLGPILERNIVNLSRILPAHGSLAHLQALVNDGLQKGMGHTDMCSAGLGALGGIIES